MSVWSIVVYDCGGFPSSSFLSFGERETHKFSPRLLSFGPELFACIMGRRRERKKETKRNEHTTKSSSIFWERRREGNLSNAPHRERLRGLSLFFLCLVGGGGEEKEFSFLSFFISTPEKKREAAVVVLKGEEEEGEINIGGQKKLFLHCWLRY